MRDLIATGINYTIGIAALLAVFVAAVGFTKALVDAFKDARAKEAP
jgi:hypothetical protein